MEIDKKISEEFCRNVRRFGRDNGMSDKQMMEMLKEETKLAEIAAAKDKEIREHDEKIEEKVNAKDSEKRAFNWKLAGGASLALAVTVGIAASVLGGDFNFKLPTKKI